ncbi:MAG: glycosyltransferase, partial [Chloroflexi bacterium]|nr:glycosyltransferase [Chloroflexota bacterium]
MGDENKVEVSVLIPVFNGRRFLDKCLQSVLDQDFPRDLYEIVAVDNASRDGSADYIAANYPDVRLIRNERNFGPDAGVAKVLPLLRGRYFAYLSQDIVVQRHWLKALYDAMQHEPQARMAASNIYFTWWPEYKPDDRINLPERAYVCDLTGYGVLDYYPVPLAEQPEAIQVLATELAAALVDLRVVQEMGYLVDEDFFMYGDVIDMCLRINSMGFKVLFVPRSVVFNESDWVLKFNRRTLNKALRSARNNLLAFWKVCYDVEFLALVPRLLIGHLHRGGQHGLSRWKNMLLPIAAIPIALWGLWAAILHMPKTAPKRRL